MRIYLQAVFDLYGPWEEAWAFLEQCGQLVHICHLVGVLQLLHSEFNHTVVDVVHQKLKDSGADVLQLNGAVVALFQVGREHGAEKTALGREHQPVKMKLFAVHCDGDISEQSTLQAEVHDALHHTAGVGTVSESVAQKVVFLAHRAPNTETPLLSGIHLCCSPEEQRSHTDSNQSITERDASCNPYCFTKPIGKKIKSNSLVIFERTRRSV